MTTRKRTIRVDDALWGAFKDACHAQGTDASGMLRSFADAFVGGRVVLPLDVDEQRWLVRRASQRGMTAQEWVVAMVRWGKGRVEAGRVPPWET